ncbi:hypothetical protein BGZ57DRAFT_291480 [Hyaloscypha finlandica]|nr:hypothetical protein BGZ57DRAFT_291480 [Hyaloscypha finlandica]
MEGSRKRLPSITTPLWLRMAAILYLRSSSLPSPSSFLQGSHTQPSLSLALPLSSPSARCHCLGSRLLPRADEAMAVVIPFQLCRKAKHPQHCLRESRSTNREVGMVANSQLHNEYPKISLIFETATGHTCQSAVSRQDPMCGLHD